MSLPFSSIGLFTYLRTYARRHDEGNVNSTLESWDECITRVLNGCKTQLNLHFTVNEEREVYDLLYNLKCSVAGRFLWQLGTRTVDKMGLNSLQNCSYVTIDEPIKPFVWAMNFLMLGSGVGYRLLPSDIAKLPIVKSVSITRIDSKDADYIIPDSREGWIKLLSKVLKAHFYSGRNFTFSCILLRSKGAPIKGFGGTASGPDTLCDGMNKINQILNNRSGLMMRPIDALDVMNVIGYIVVSGNVRRCKPIKTLVHTRNGLKKIENVSTNDEVLTSYGYSKVLENIYQGEQRIIQIKTSLGPSFCTEGHRMAVMTSCNTYDWKKAHELVDGDFLIFSTDIIEGSITTLPTYEHVNPILNTDTAWFIGFMKIASSMLNAECVVNVSNSLIRKCITNLVHFGVIESTIFTDLSDDQIKIRFRNDSFCAYFEQLYTDQFEMHRCILEAHCSIRTAFVAGLFDASPIEHSYTKDTAFSVFSHRNAYFITQIQSIYSSLGLPTRKSITNHTLDIIGIYSVNKFSGMMEYSVLYRKVVEPCGNGDNYHLPNTQTVDDYFILYDKYPKYFPIRVYGVSQTNQVEHTFDLSVENKHEYFCGEGLLNHNSAQIAIGDCNDIEFMKAKRWDLGHIPNYRAFSNNSVICNDIEDIISNDNFWAGYNGNGEPYGLINLNLMRQCGRVGDTRYPDPLVEGVNPCAEQLLANYESCCLSELFLPHILSREELYKCATYMYRICKHSLTLPCPNSKETEDIVHKHMRMGIGVTGYLQATEEQRSWLADCYEYLRNFDIVYSLEHNFPPSIKLTTCKPSGTLSLLGGVTAGVHPGYSQYYIRRIRISADSPLVSIAENHGYPIEYVKQFDGTLDRNTKVISFPHQLPSHTIFADDCSAVQQMEYVRRLQTEWSDNAVSVTITYKSHELDDIKNWLRINYNTNVKSISFLLHSGHGFIQAPIEPITKEQYDSMVESCRPITSVENICYKVDNNTESECSNGCPIR